MVYAVPGLPLASVTAWASGFFIQIGNGDNNFYCLIRLNLNRHGAVCLDLHRYALHRFVVLLHRRASLLDLFRPAPDKYSIAYTLAYVNPEL